MTRWILLSLFTFSSVSAYGQLLGPENAISAAGPSIPVATGTPRLATNGTDFLAVWGDARANGDVYAARIDSHGTVLDPTGIHLATGQAFVSAASDGRDYLAAIAAPCSTLSVLRVGGDGTVGDTKTIGNTNGLCAGAELASNGDTYLAVWLPGNAALLDRDGNILAGPFTVGSFERSLVVASNGRDYMIAGSSTAGTPLTVVPISARGVMGVPQNYASAGYADMAIASDGSNYAVVTNSGGIAVAVIRADGSLINSEIDQMAGGPLQYPRIAWNGSRYVIGYIHWTIATSTLESVDLDPFSGVMTPGAHVSDVAADSLRYDLVSTQATTLLVWMTGYFPSFAAVSPSEVAVSSELVGRPLVVAPRSQVEATLLGNGVTLLASWRERSSTESHSSVRAAVIDGDGRPITAPVELAQQSSGPPFRMAFAGTTLIASWFDGTTLYARRFTSSLQPIDPAPVVISQNVLSWDPPTLVAADDVALLAYSSNGDIAGALLSTNGPSMTVLPITIAALPFNDHSVSVAWNGSQFLVAWAHARGPEPTQGAYPEPPDDIVDVRVDRDGRVLDSQPHTVASLSQSSSSLSASNGTDFFVVWATEGIVGQHVDVNGVAVGRPTTIASSTNYGNVTQIASRGDGYVVAWSQVTNWPFEYAVNLTKITGDVTGVQTTELPHVQRDLDGGGGGGSVAFAGNQAIVAYDRLAPEFAGVSRVFTRTVDTSLVRRRAAH